jgi:hypothetical protein
MSLKVSLNDKGEPTGIDLDGKPLFVNSMDISLRPCVPMTVKLEAYVRDLSTGGLTVKNPVTGEPEVESLEFYAVSKEDYELLQKLRSAP